MSELGRKCELSDRIISRCSWRLSTPRIYRPFSVVQAIVLSLGTVPGMITSLLIKYWNTRVSFNRKKRKRRRRRIVLMAHCSSQNNLLQLQRFRQDLPAAIWLITTIKITIMILLMTYAKRTIECLAAYLCHSRHSLKDSAGRSNYSENDLFLIS